MVAVKVMTVDGGDGGQGRGRRQTNLCLEIPGLDKKNLCSTMLWSKAYPQKRMGPRTQESNKPDNRLQESLAPPTVDGADCRI